MTGDVTYTATYSSTVNKYTVRFVDEDGTELQSGELEYGKTPVYSGEDPIKEADEDHSYTFKGWTPELTAVAGDTTYTAAYEAVPKGILTFDLGEGSLNGQTGTLIIKAYVGDVITIPAGPLREGYEFLYWEGSKYYPGDTYTVTGSHMFTAVYQKNEPAVVTGDGTQTVLLLGLLLASASGVAVLLGKKRFSRS